MLNCVFPLLCGGCNVSGICDELISQHNTTSTTTIAFFMETPEIKRNTDGDILKILNTQVNIRHAEKKTIFALTNVTFPSIFA